MYKKLISCSLALALLGTVSHAQKKLTVEAGKPVTAVPATMWGIFFEDINFGADGGLYAELVKNRSFEFPMPLMGWKELKKGGGTGKTLIINEEKERPQNPRFARITVAAPANTYGLSNEGFRGMGIHAGETYHFSVLAKKEEGDVKLTIELVNAAGKKIGGASLQNFSSGWQSQTVSFTAADSAAKGRLNIYFEGKGTVDVDMVSLFPEKTWKQRPGGLRADLVQKLADLKPGFIRFPGGCIVEGRDLTNRYQWKATIGPVADRKLMLNRWNVEFPRRNAPDYYQTFGLGFYEYFQLAEDLGAEPLPILNCGMACQYNSGEVAALNELDPFVQDALDLIEFANGDVSTRWGGLRASLGHPAPFHLKFLGVGNEQWEEQYIDRYKVFEKALKQRYPEVKLVAAAGPSPDGPRFDYAWKELRQLHADLLDEHYYQKPEWFLSNAGRYDHYDRKGPKVFAGEYAAHGKEEPQAESKNTWMSALSEAAFMTGLERNADVVQMASYAPLLAHVDAWQWRPDLIWFDNLRSVATPNYYVQQLFSNYKGTDVLSVTQDGKVLEGADSLYGSAVLDKDKKQVIVKLVNASGAPLTYEVAVNGVSLSGKNATVSVLSSSNPWAINTLDQQQNIAPVEKTIGIKGKNLVISLPPMSLNVVRMNIK